jgi:small Trp-rich protein
MWLLWIGVALVLLRYFEISVFATLSWWWVTLPLVLALIWFEVFERRLGLDKKKAFDEMEEHKARRIKRALEADNARRGRR